MHGHTNTHTNTNTDIQWHIRAYITFDGVHCAYGIDSVHYIFHAIFPPHVSPTFPLCTFVRAFSVIWLFRCVQKIIPCSPFRSQFCIGVGDHKQKNEQRTTKKKKKPNQPIWSYIRSRGLYVCWQQTHATHTAVAPHTQTHNTNTESAAKCEFELFQLCFFSFVRSFVVRIMSIEHMN